MTTQPPPRPELQLIRDHRTRLGLSLARAGKLAGISYGYWKQVEDGTREIKGAKGLRTVARMAHAVGVEPAELQDAGAAELAAELEVVRELAAQQETQARQVAERMVDAVPALSEHQRARLLKLVTEDVRDVRENG